MDAQLQIKLIFVVFFRFILAQQIMFLGYPVLIYAPCLVPVFLLLLQGVRSLLLHAHSLIVLVVLLCNSPSVTLHAVMFFNQAVD